MKPGPLDLESYAYDLPPELIAQYPLAERDSSRLLHLERSTGEISHLRFSGIEGLLRAGDVLVLNSSKVIPARLLGHKDNGTPVEVFLLRQLEGPRWQCLVHPGKRLKAKQWVVFSPGLKGLVSLPDPEGLREVEFAPDTDYWQEVEKVGHIPLPPYIHRPDEAGDRLTYQTVYASTPGSVAAPTAGLHFTQALLERLRHKGVLVHEVTLHVGMGTFLPVKVERIDQHRMHSEFCSLPPATAEAVNLALREGRRVIPVGSTSMRTLESFFREGELQSGSHWTDIFIYPGVEIKVASALLTNFHLPRSSLLMMISAFAGLDLVKQAYQAAVAERYRFFSYGDAMFIS